MDLSINELSYLNKLIAYDRNRTQIKSYNFKIQTSLLKKINDKLKESEEKVTTILKR